jgi:acyl dehydratase
MPTVGQQASFTRTLTEGDVSLFIGATWDVHPLHTDDRYARASRFGRRIVPGLLTASLGTHLGGLWAFVAQEMSFRFLAPVYIGDTVTLTVEFVECDPARAWVRMEGRAVNQDGVEVMRFEVSGFLPAELRTP